MLIISRRHRCIFLHLRKCGGTSIFEALGPIGDVPVPEYRAHATLDECRSLLDDAEIRAFRKIMVVRNTWERVESGYWHLLREPLLDVNAYLDVRANGFAAFVRGHAKSILGTQDRWLYYQGELQDVEIIRFDALAAGVARLAAEMGVACRLGWLNRTEGREGSTIYTPETVALVAQVFAREIDTFGFRAPMLPAPQQHDEATLRELTRRLITASDAVLDRALGHPAEALDFARIGDAASLNGNLVAAAEAYQRAHEREPGNPWHLYARALVLRRLERIDAALDAVGAALTLSPDFAEALQEKALLQSAAGDDAAAQATLEHAIRLHPGQACLHHALSFSLMRLNQLAAAITAAERAVFLDPDLVPALVHLGFLYLGTQQPERALCAMQRAIELAPDDPDALYGRGRALLALGDADGARTATLAALQLRPDDTEYRRQLADAEAIDA